MDFFLIFIALVALGSFLKFIWDSFLTDNTEKKWKEYKQKFPAEAERTERNSFKKVDENLTGKQGNLTNRLQNLMTFYNNLPPELNAQIVTNTANCFEFKMPVTLFEKVVGYNHVGVAEQYPKFEMYLYSVSTKGKKISLKPIPFNLDLSLEKYKDTLSELYEKLVPRPDYQKLASGEDFEVMTQQRINKLIAGATQAFDDEDFETTKSNLHVVIRYLPNFYQAYLMLIKLYLDENELYEADELIGALNVRQMKGLINFNAEGEQTFKDLKFRKFELREKRMNDSR